MTGSGGRCASVRTLFLSDLHLGYRHARTRELAEFLQSTEAECIVLAGDIIDTPSRTGQFFWTAAHTEVARLLLAKNRAGARLIYIPGNHDASLGMLAELLSGKVEVHQRWVFRTQEGRRLLVVHGDRFDGIVTCGPGLTRIADALYYLIVGLSDIVNDLRRAFGRTCWPLAERIKLGFPPSLRYIERFENAAANYARAAGFDGVICGHIHRANLRHLDGILYGNTGDWIESCSALIETLDGELQLLRWPNGLAPARPVTTHLATDAA